MSSERRGYPRAKLKWPVTIKTEEGSTEGVTRNITPDGCFISCRRPLRLNVVFALVIKIPNSKSSIDAEAEVVWSNIYGPDDEITPRGMGVRFLKIKSEMRKFIAKTALEYFKAKDIESDLIETLNTLVIDLSAEKKKVPGE
jgi:uncharacterized protein (TIGR02266 family)